jgi:hypothetical protein
MRTIAQRGRQEYNYGPWGRQASLARKPKIMTLRLLALMA